MSVSAVIPTIGRPELLRAVDSVLEQSVPVDVVVVLDRPDREDDVRALLGGRPYRLVLTRGATGGGNARNLGVASTETDWVAFLDDDDRWLPSKTLEQLRVASATGADVIASRAHLVSGHARRIAPKNLFDQDMATYLLDRSTLRLGKNFMQSSSLLIRREAAIGTPWRPELPRHQDWTLLIDLEREGYTFATHPSALVEVYQGSRESVSKSTNWRASEDWVDTVGNHADHRSRADFLCSVAMRSAIAAREWKQAARLLVRAIRLRPHPTALLVAVAELSSAVRLRRATK